VGIHPLNKEMFEYIDLDVCCFFQYTMMLRLFSVYLEIKSKKYVKQ